jgi:hypothetical protein
MGGSLKAACFGDGREQRLAKHILSEPTVLNVPPVGLWLPGRNVENLFTARALDVIALEIRWDFQL